MTFLNTICVPLLMRARAFRSKKRAYIFHTESVGSVGDQAMADVVQTVISAEYGYDVTSVNMPGWTPSKTRADHREMTLGSYGPRNLGYWRMFAGAELLISVGADVIDGHYGPDLPCKWLSDLRMAQSLGIANGVVNFSFSEQAHPDVRAMVAQMKGTQFVSRDPVSRNRFQQATGQVASLSADLAFLLKPQITTPAGQAAHDWAAGKKAQGQTVLAVNASGHTLEKMPDDGVIAYAAICRAWLTADAARAIILIPHDYRPAPVDDVEPLARIYEMLADFGDRVYFLRPYFAAWEVKAICEHVDLGFTGRMHLAIAALGMAAPVLNVSYVGKFQGLMQHCGLEDDDLVIKPSMVLDVANINARLEILTAKAAVLRTKLLARLPAIQAMSRNNFDWIKPA